MSSSPWKLLGLGVFIREKLGQGEAIVVRVSHHRTIILKKKNERYKNLYLLIHCAQELPLSEKAEAGGWSSLSSPSGGWEWGTPSAAIARRRRSRSQPYPTTRTITRSSLARRVQTAASHLMSLSGEAMAGGGH